MSADDFAHEPVRGLPQALPEGERILWQGAPAWRALAARAFGVRLVLAYFAALALWRIAEALGSGLGWGAAVGSALLLVPIALASVAILALMAWVAAKATVYTITNRRVVMRIGVALTLSLNLPFRQIEAADLRLDAGGAGDIPLRIAARGRLAYLALWPHCRPWRFARPEPALRAVPDAARVAAILGHALAEATGGVATEPAAAKPALARPGALAPAG